MLFQRTPALLRSAVAFFNMKHFQVREKIKVNPSNINQIFSTYLEPGDRLLRQSRVGSGSTRVLVLDNFQKVKGVYLPVLCVTHPATVKEHSTLGLPVSQYLETVKLAQEQGHTTFAALSYPTGIAFIVFNALGKAQMKLVKVKYSHTAADPLVAKSIGKHALFNAGNANRTRSREFLLSLQDSFDEIRQCSTFFIINRERGTCLMLDDLLSIHRQASKVEEDEGEEMITGVENQGPPLNPEVLTVFNNADRWITLPEQSLQSQPSAPLYTRGEVNEKGLQMAFSSGVLLLDSRSSPNQKSN